LDLLKILEIAKRYGARKIATMLSSIAWFVLPSLSWNLVRSQIGNAYFLIPYAVIGFGLAIFTLLFESAQSYYYYTYEFNLMKRVEYARSIFNDPSNPENERNYLVECRRFILPCVYQLPVLLSSFRGAVSRFFPFGVFGVVLRGYCSYSIFTVVIAYRIQITDMTRMLISNMPYSEHVVGVLIRTLQQYQLHSLVLVLLLSVSSDWTIRRRRLLRKMTPVLFASSVFDLMDRGEVLVDRLLRDLILIPKLKNQMSYKPFVDPQTLPNVVQRAVQNIEGASCNVSKWSQDHVDIQFADEVKKLFREDRKIPVFLRIACLLATSEGILADMRLMQPFLYLGTIDNRCLFLGLVWYNPSDRTRQATLRFDNSYIKEEFRLIMGKQIEKRRELESVLPSSLEEIAKRMEVGAYGE